MADVPEKPIAEWLRASRKAQKTPDGDDWTYAYLFDRMLEDIGWAPAHPNYSKYENGKATPNRETLAKFVRFWAGHGVEGPDLSPKTPAGPKEATPFDPADLYGRMESLTAALADLVTELRSTRQERDELRAGLEATERMATDNSLRLAALERRTGRGDGADEGHAAPHQTGGSG